MGDGSPKIFVRKSIKNRVMVGVGSGLAGRRDTVGGVIVAILRVVPPILK